MFVRIAPPNPLAILRRMNNNSASGAQPSTKVEVQPLVELAVRTDKSISVRNFLKGNFRG